MEYKNFVLVFQEYILEYKWNTKFVFLLGKGHLALYQLGVIYFE